ncbi:MAG: hypothetical protein ACFE94_12485 [Candidatus Hodarchaeota archaeon]
MANRNQTFTSTKKFKSIFIAKRVSYWGIILSVALIIMSMFSILVILFYPPLPHTLIYRPTDVTREDLIQIIISSITIPSLLSTFIFILINLILKKILKKFYPTSNEKEIINILESLKLRRIQDPDPSNLF